MDHPFSNQVEMFQVEERTTRTLALPLEGNRCDLHVFHLQDSRITACAGDLVKMTGESHLELVPQCAEVAQYSHVMARPV